MSTAKAGVPDFGKHEADDHKIIEKPPDYEDEPSDSDDESELEEDEADSAKHEQNKDKLMKVQKFGIGYSKRKFPDGMAGERLMGHRTINMEKKTPRHVQSFMEDKNATDLYEKFAHVMVNEGRTKHKRYVRNNMVDLIDQFQPKFNEKNIRVVLCSNTVWYYVSHGQYGGHMQRVCYKWIEYIDLECYPDYLDKIVEHQYSKKYGKEKKEKRPKNYLKTVKKEKE